MFELVSAQKVGRVEVLLGMTEMLNKGEIKLQLESVSIMNDSQMIRSGIVLYFTNDKLHYELKMSTEKNPSYKTHLAAQLIKI